MCPQGICFHLIKNWIFHMPLLHSIFRCSSVCSLTCVEAAGHSETAGWPWGSSGGEQPFWVRVLGFPQSRHCLPSLPWLSRSSHSASADTGFHWSLHCGLMCCSSHPTDIIMWISNTVNTAQNEDFSQAVYLFKAYSPCVRPAGSYRPVPVGRI